VSNADRLAGKVVIVTGAAGAIGAATTRRLADEGAVVVVTDLDQGKCDDLVVQLPGGKSTHLSVGLDVSVEADWVRLCDELAQRRVRVNGLVNNAAVASVRPVELEERDRWDRVVAVSQTGAWLGMKHGGRLMMAGDGGAIVNVCSIAGVLGLFGESVAYHASKGAVRSMTRNAAVRWAKDAIRVNAVIPGFVETPYMIASLQRTSELDAIMARTPMGRLAQPGEISAAIAFLLSDDASFITGSELCVDGGWTAS
jgi:3alpha(or 20beta)-hydroxysteroid dehydrogenase